MMRLKIELFVHTNVKVQTPVFYGELRENSFSHHKIPSLNRLL